MLVYTHISIYFLRVYDVNPGFHSHFDWLLDGCPALPVAIIIFEPPTLTYKGLHFKRQPCVRISTIVASTKQYPPVNLRQPRKIPTFPHGYILYHQWWNFHGFCQFTGPGVKHPNQKHKKNTQRQVCSLYCQVIEAMEVLQPGVKLRTDRKLNKNIP